MSRRGHLSHKIPNVKLRPAPAPSNGAGPSKKVKRADSPEVWRDALNDDGGMEEDGDMQIGGSSRPWKGIVITMTGVEDKPYLTGLIKELGGTVETALTIHVTHVVSTAYESAKYVYAIDHHIPVMTSSWIIESHSRWLAGEELDFKRDLDRYRLKPFFDLKIAISGIEPLERRRQLVDYITEHGGLYFKDLDRSCTHLVSAKPTSDPKSSEKVKWALKELQDRDSARRKGRQVKGADMKIVYEEWIWDCIAYNGRFAEDKYDARRPRPKGKVRAEDVLNGTLFQDVKEKEEGAKRKEEDDEPAVIKKRKKEAIDSLVGDIISTSSARPKPGDEQQESTRQNIDLEQKDQVNEDVTGKMSSDKASKDQKKPSMLHMSRQQSFTAATAMPKPFDAQPEGGPSSPTKTNAAAIAGSDVNPTPKFFDGLRFSHVIEENCQNLERALQGHGGILVPEEERLAGADVDYVIVRLVSARRPDMSKTTGKQPTVVTECWVEACCFEQRMLSPDDHLVFRPLPAPMPVPGAEKLEVHLSGWQTGDSVYLKRLLRAIGGKLSLKLTKETTHLVCSSPDSAKALKCFEWGIPVLRNTWLLSIGRSGKIEDVDSHLHEKPSQLAPAPTTSTAAAPANRRLSNSTKATSNFSGISDVGQPEFKGATSSTPKIGELRKKDREISRTSSSGSTGIAPSRQLKSTPTHIDNPLDTEDGLKPDRSIAAEQLPLSPPGPERERMLNRAVMPVHPSRAGLEKSIESKISRTSSAPAPEVGSLEKDMRDKIGGNKRAASLTANVIADTGVGSTKKDVTDVLRQLSERSTTTPNNSSKLRAQRRNRQSSARIRAGAQGVSPLMKASLSPASNGFMDPEEDITMAEDSGVNVSEEVAESIGIRHYDPNAERERRKLMALMNNPSG